MGSRGGGGCAGALVLLFLASMLVSLIIFVVALAAVVAALGAAGWLLASAIGDMQRRSALGAGTEPTQITGEIADSLADRALAAAQDGVMSTLDDWEQLRVTRAIGTPLQESFRKMEERTVRNLDFQELTVQASTRHARSFHLQRPTARDKVAAANELDSLTVELREAIHEAATDR